MAYEMRKLAVFILAMLMILFMASIIFVPGIFAEAGEMTKAVIISFQTTAMPGISEIAKK